MERELWKAMYVLAIELDKPWGSWRYSTADVLGAYFWAVVHDRPTAWASDPAQWPDELRPALLPPQNTLSRRLRQAEAVELMTTLGQCLMHIIDGKALAVSAVSKDPDAGYGRGAGAQQKGYKWHAVWSDGPMPLAWGLAPMNTSGRIQANKNVASRLGRAPTNSTLCACNSSTSFSNGNC